MRLFLEKIIFKIENQPFVFQNWIITFLTLISLRVFEEEIINGFVKKNLFDFLAFWGHTFSFFLFSFLIFLFILRKITNNSFDKIANVLLWGLGVILFPPLVDKIFFKNQFVWSFYLFTDFFGFVKKFFLFFGDNLRIGVTLGVRIEIFLAIIGIATYIYLKKKKKRWFFYGFFLFYFILYILGSFPTFLTFFINLFQKNSSWLFFEKDVVDLFLVPFSVFSFKNLIGGGYFAWKMTFIYYFLIVFLLVFLQKKINKEVFWALLKNVRFPQMVFNSGLFVFGLIFGYWLFPNNLTKDFFSVLIIFDLWIAIFSAWFFSVLVNDEEDLETDKKTNTNRPLVKKILTIKEYHQYQIIFFFFSLFFPLLISWKLFFLFLVYHGLTFLYSCYPFRLKRFVGIASFLSATASIIFLLVGFFLFSEEQNFTKLPWRFVFFFFFSFFLLIPLKDLKDIEGDRYMKVWTLPVLIGEKRSRLFFAVLFLINYLLSVYIFKEKNLFLPAIIAGSGTFWLIVNQKISSRSLLGWIIFFLVGYFFFLLKLFFFF